MITHTRKRGGKKRVFKTLVEFRAFCREQVRQGMINSWSGGWIRFSPTGSSMHADMKGGYRL